MNIHEAIFQKNVFRYLDHSMRNKIGDDLPYDAIASFAVDDALALSVSNGTSPHASRLWVHDKTVVLGIPDTRLPFIVDGVTFLHNNGYNTIVRNSGGLAVALDDGVLNISLILPGVKHLSIYECYEAMVYFVKFMFRDLTEDIQAYEIIGSYCPGDYDLSINGKKFAGISQRRVKEGASIQIYLDICGDSDARADLIRKFYELSTREATLKNPPPNVKKETMSSLSNLLGVTITMEEAKARAKDSLDLLSEGLLFMPDLSEDELDHFVKRYSQMVRRNEDIQKIINDIE